MLVTAENHVPDALKITGMNTYTNDSTGSRVAWARKQKLVQDADGRRRPMNGHELAAAVGVRNVYISQIENNHRIPSRDVLQKIAETLGVTVGFLLMETDIPQPAGVKPETPVYFSEEADAAAKLIDDVPPEKRREMLAVLRVMAESALATDTKDSAGENGGRVIYLPYHPSADNPVRDRLIQSALLPQSGEVMRS
jgi:transcriptional regulator with XRE-family HTH domain